MEWKKTPLCGGGMWGMYSYDAWSPMPPSGDAALCGLRGQLHQLGSQLHPEQPGPVCSGHVECREQGGIFLELTTGLQKWNIVFTWTHFYIRCHNSSPWCTGVSCDHADLERQLQWQADHQELRGMGGMVKRHHHPGLQWLGENPQVRSCRCSTRLDLGSKKSLV